MYYEIMIKERGREKPLHVTHSGNVNRWEVIRIFGLEEADVEWYEIKEIED